MSISLFMLGCNGSYTSSVLCIMPHTVGDKIQFRISFHRMAVARLKIGLTILYHSYGCKYF